MQCETKNKVVSKCWELLREHVQTNSKRKERKLLTGSRPRLFKDQQVVDSKGGSLGIWAGQSSRLVIKSTMILFNLPIKDYRRCKIVFLKPLFFEGI